jgi:hypothetical protein
MPLWIQLDSQPAIEDLLERFNGFHDGCLREVALATETFVDERGAMACPGHLDTSALLYFQSQSEHLPAIEIRCVGISQFRLRPTGDNCDSIISYGTVAQEQARCRLAVSFVGGPLTGPPNGAVWVSPAPPEDPDLEVVARSMAWRPLADARGEGLRYRAPDPEGRRATR